MTTAVRPEALRPPAPPAARARVWAGPVVLRVAREAVLLVGLLTGYQAARLHGVHDVPAAFAHARGVLGLERWLHLPAEQHLQHALLHVDRLARAANTFYAEVHLPATGLALLWLLLWRPEHYLPARRALLSATAAGLVVFLLLPVAPPRMLPGFVDTGLLYGQSVYDDSGVANQYAAMPSLHVGWALLVAVALIRATRTRWRWLWLAHPALTMLVVVSTGNHYWLDGLAGAALVLAALAVFRSPARTPSSEGGLIAAAAPTRPRADSR